MCGRGIREGLGTGVNGLVAGQKLRARSRVSHCGRPPIFEACSRLPIAPAGRSPMWSATAFKEGYGNSCDRHFIAL